MHHTIIRARFLLLALLLGATLHAQADNGVSFETLGAIIGRLNPRPLLIVGELHGSDQAPALAAALVERLAQQAPVRLGLEIYAQEQARIDTYLASNGNAEARAALLAGEFWQRPREKSDGRRSRAMFALIEHLRVLQRGGAPVDVVAFDDVGFYGADRSGPRCADGQTPAHRAARSCRRTLAGVDRQLPRPHESAGEPTHPR